MHEYVVMYLANQRQNTAKAKTRAEIVGSGRKLFRQKGTGRARVGAANSPIRRKGGVAFGPSPERNRMKSMNQKAKQKALLSSFLLQLKQGTVQGLQERSFSAPKTKEAASVLQALGLSGTKTLIILDAHNDAVYRSLRNIPGVSVTTLDLLNPYQLVTHTQVLVTKQAVVQLPERFHLLSHS